MILSPSLCFCSKLYSFSTHPLAVRVEVDLMASHSDAAVISVVIVDLRARGDCDSRQISLVTRSSLLSLLIEDFWRRFSRDSLVRLRAWFLVPLLYLLVYLSRFTSSIFPFFYGGRTVAHEFRVRNFFLPLSTHCN